MGSKARTQIKLNRVQAASILTLFMLFTVPSLAFSGDSEPSCYQAELLYDDLEYGKVKLIISGNKIILKVEIEEFTHIGEYTVEIFKEYYSNFVAGTMEIDDDGNGKAVFEIPFQSPDFIVYVRRGENVLISGEWIECEKPVKPVDVKVSPSSLNLKSMGKWVTVKIAIPIGDLVPTNFKMIVNDYTIDSYSAKISQDHIILKFSRAELQEICEEGEEEVILSFKIGDQTIELSDNIKVINKGKNIEAISARENSAKTKTKKSKAKRKNKNK